jgi:putative membrane protein
MAHGPGGWAGASAGPPPLANAIALPVPVAWNWRPEVLLPLALLLTVYGIGWWRLRGRSRSLAPPWRLLSWISGIVAVGAALISPIDRLADDLFFVHMIQHLLLIKVAAPAMLLANPLPAILWGLPRPIRLPAGRLLAPGAPVRIAAQALTWLPVAWLAYTVTLWLWHLPGPYDAALGDRLLHDGEHLAFFWTAVLFWWPLIGPAPRLGNRAQPGARIVYLVLAAFQETVLGLLLAVVPWVLYSSYALAPRVLVLGAQEDQAWGGIIMWGAGGAIDMLAVLVLVFRLLGQKQQPTPSIIGIRPRGAS